MDLNPVASDAIPSSTGQPAPDAASPTSMGKPAHDAAKGVQTNMIIISIGAVLACCAGMVNSISFLEFGTFVSHVSGTTTRVGLKGQELFFDEDALGDLLLGVGLIVAFVCGAAICGFLKSWSDHGFSEEVNLGHHVYGSACFGTAFLLLIAMHFSKYRVAVLVLAMACGLQNGMCTLFMGTVIRTTHVTGLATDLGTHYGRLAGLVASTRGWRQVKAGDRAEASMIKAKLVIYHSLGGSFLLGGFIGAWLTMGLGSDALFVPASILALVGLFYFPSRPHLQAAAATSVAVRHAHAQPLSDVSRQLARAQALLDEYSRRSADITEAEHVRKMVDEVLTTISKRYALQPASA